MVISDHACAGCSDEVVLEREGRGAGTRRNAELYEDVLDVPGDRVLADHQRDRDVAIALARSNQSQHLELAT
jgi:hypothetical protein